MYQCQCSPCCQISPIIRAGDVTLLLSEGADPNIASREHNTALYIACKQENFEIASKLIDAGADTNPESCSPLWIACESNYIDIAELLLENRADSSWSPPEGHSNYFDNVEPALENTAYISMSTSEGDSDSSSDCSEPFKSLPEISVDSSSSSESVFSSEGHSNDILNIAHSNGHYEVVRLLLEYGADPSVLSGIGLKTACELGYTEVAQRIIHESHVSPDVLEQCIEGAYKNGFLTAVLEAIMDISEQNLKDYCVQLVCDLLLNKTTAVTAQNPADIVRDNMSLWGCLEKRDMVSMRMLIGDGHNVNIPNVTGRSLLQECIQQRITHVIPDLCNSQIHIDHRDSAGRTALFYSLTCPDMYTIHGESISVFEYLTSKGADVSVRDYFGRSVLHEWQPLTDGLKHGPSLERLLQHIDINSTDHKGQTPLHLAVLNNSITSVRQLLEHGANIEVHDINHITPLFLAHKKHDILKALKEDYPDYEYKIQDSPSGEDHKQRVHMLNNISKKHRLVPALHEVFKDRAKYTQTDHFMNKYEPRVYYTMKKSIREEKVLFEETVLQLLRAINVMVIQEEPMLSFTPRLSGSCAEGTKVIAVDEADMLCVFDDDSWRHITLSQVSNNAHTYDNSSFVQITSLSTKHQTLLNDGYVSKRKLLQRMYSLVRKALPAVLKNFKSLYMIDVKNTVTNDHSLACLSMVWHGQELPWQEFTVDVVPAIPVSQEQLPNATRQAMSHSHIIQDLFVVPKTGTFDQSQSDVAFRLSFSSTERDLFLAMPTALKQGYMLTKVLVHDCVTIDDISLGICSYNLKTAAFQCFKSETPNWEDLVIQARKTVPVNVESQAMPVVRCAQNILQEVERSFVQKHQDSFFLRGCDLMVHSIDKNDYRQIVYVKYCTAMLSDTEEAAWQQLAECVAQQLLESENMHERYVLREIETLLDMGLKSQMNVMLEEMIRLGQVEVVRMMLERSVFAEGVDIYAFGLAKEWSNKMFTFLEDNVKGKLILDLCVIINVGVPILIIISDKDIMFFGSIHYSKSYEWIVIYFMEGSGVIKETRD